MIGIALAVAVLIVVLSVMNGFESELQRRILGMVSDASIVGSEMPLVNWREARDRVLARGDVEAVAPYVEGQAMAVAGSTIAGVTVRGIDPELEAQVSTIRSVMTSGDLAELTSRSYRGSDRHTASRVARRRCRRRDRALPAGADRDARRLGAAQRSFTISGIFDAGMYEYDRGLVFTSFDDAARMYRTDGEATGLRLSIADLYNSREVANAAAQELVNERGGKVYIDDWTQLHYTFFRSIQLQKSMMFVILSLVIAVAAFNIVSTLMMVVRDKRGDIAILRSFGATQRSVMTLFASQGTFIGVIGTLLGVLLALAISWQLGNIVNLLQGWFGVDLLSAEVYYLEDLPTQVRPIEVLQIGGMALALAIAATFYPSLSAARQPPAEALRYE